MTSKVLPIKPAEVGGQKSRDFPNEVFESFNELIAQNFSSGFAKIKQEDIVALMIKKGLIREEINEKGYLNVEEVYRSTGWDIVYDKPGYSETYDATFTFRLPSF